MTIQYHLYISGDVQGINLRYALKQRANLLSLVGWVRNLPDNRVEAVIQGEENDIKEIIDWLPSYTQIDDIKIEKEKVDKKLINFEIR